MKTTRFRKGKYKVIKDGVSYIVVFRQVTGKWNIYKRETLDNHGCQDDWFEAGNSFKEAKQIIEEIG